MPYSLYRLYGDEDTLLYVGMSMNLPGRLTNHRVQKPWWTLVRHITVEHFETKAAVLTAEREAIQSEQPIWNIQHNLGRDLTAVGPHEEAIELLFGLAPGLEHPASRRALAAAFDVARRDDERADGSPADYSGWPEELKALVQSVGDLADREYVSTAIVQQGLHLATGGRPARALAIARATFVDQGEPNPAQDDLERFALLQVIRYLVDHQNVDPHRAD